MKKSLTTQLVTMAFLIALEIILTRFLSINLQFVRIGFGFVPVAIAAIMYGPVWAGAGYAIGDVLGMMIFPTGPYFPGFTLTAFIIGVIYGLFLHNRKINIPNVAAAVVTVNVSCTLLLNTYWLTLLYGNATFIALLPARLAEACILCAVEVPIIIALWKNALVRIPNVRMQVGKVSLEKGLR